MRTLYVAIFLLAIGVLPTKANTIQFSGRFAVINSERIFNETNLAKAMIETLRSEFLSRQNQLLEEAKSNPADSTLLSRQEAFTADLNRRTFEERQKIAVAGNVKLLEFAKKENISIIVQTAAFVDPASDITNQIISLLDGKQTIDNVVFQGPKNSRVLVLNPPRFYQSFDVATGANLTAKQKKDQDELTAKGNSALKLIAEKNKIDIVLQEAAYLSQTSDLTTKLISVVKNSTFDSSSLNIDNSGLATTMAVVNSEKIFSTFPNKNRLKLAEAGNIALNKFSQDKKINIILQEAAYVSSSHDVTADVIKLIIPPLENEVAPTSNTNLPVKNPTENLADAKAKCLDLGFKNGTDGFGKCVLQLSK